MHAPLVLRSGERTGAVDHHLAQRRRHLGACAEDARSERALRVIWELREQPLTFRALQERCAGMSSSVLNQRLHELRAAEILELDQGGYRLTREGRRLLESYAPLEAWAERWALRERRQASGVG